MKKLAKVTAIGNRKLIKEFMYDKLIPGVTGMAKYKKEDWIQTVSNIIQRQRKEGWLESFVIELNKMCDEGKIESDFISSEQGQECRQEILDSLAEDKPDQKRFDALKKIFLRAASADRAEWSNARPQQFMKICRTLNSEELIILGTAYRMYKSMPRADLDKISSAEEWPQAIAQKSNKLVSRGVVDHYENGLIQKALIGDRNHSDRSGIRLTRECRLTPLALELCQYLDE